MGKGGEGGEGGEGGLKKQVHLFVPTPNTNKQTNLR